MRRWLPFLIAFLFLSGCAATVYTEPEPAPMTIYRPYYGPPVYYVQPIPVFYYSRGCGHRCR